MTDLLVVCSPGGHFSEARSLVEDMDDVDFKFVLHLPPAIPQQLVSKVIVAPHAERDWRVIRQFWFAIRCVLKERPKMILSTGALIGITFGLAGKLVGAKFLFVESPTRVTIPSLSAIIAYRFADRIYVRHSALLRRLPKANLVGEDS